MPNICPEKPEVGSAGRFQKHVGGLARMRSLLPNAHYGEVCFHESSDAMRASHAMKVTIACFMTNQSPVQLHACRHSSAVYPCGMKEYLRVIANADLQRRVS